MCDSGLLLFDDKIERFGIVPGSIRNIKIRFACLLGCSPVRIELDGRKINRICRLCFCSTKKGSRREGCIGNEEIKLIVLFLSNDGSVFLDLRLLGIFFRKCFSAGKMHLILCINRRSLAPAGIDVMPLGIILHVTSGNDPSGTGTGDIYTCAGISGKEGSGCIYQFNITGPHKVPDDLFTYLIVNLLIGITLIICITAHGSGRGIDPLSIDFNMHLVKKDPVSYSVELSINTCAVYGHSNNILADIKDYDSRCSLLYGHAVRLAERTNHIIRNIYVNDPVFEFI